MDNANLRQQILRIRHTLDMQDAQAALHAMRALLPGLLAVHPELLHSPAMRRFQREADYPATCRAALDALLQELAAFAAADPSAPHVSLPQSPAARRALTRRAFLAGGLALTALATAKILQPPPVMDIAKGDMDLLAPEPPLGVAVSGFAPAPSWIPEPRVGVAPFSLISFFIRTPVRRSLIMEGQGLMPGVGMHVHINDFPLRTYAALDMYAPFRARIHLQLPISFHRIFIEYKMPEHWSAHGGEEALPPVAYSVLRFIPV